MQFAKTLAVGIFLCSSVASAQDLSTDAGTMQVGGTAAFRIITTMSRTVAGTEVPGSTDVALNLSPTVGYFVADDIELVGGVGFSKVFAEGSSSFLSFIVGLRYFIAMDMMMLPYVGADVGMGIGLPAEGDATKALALNALLGAMIPLNENVGLDIGLRVNFNLGLDDQGNSLTIPIGYFGVQAFF